MISAAQLCPKILLIMQLNQNENLSWWHFKSEVQCCCFYHQSAAGGQRCGERVRFKPQKSQRETKMNEKSRFDQNWVQKWNSKEQVRLELHLRLGSVPTLPGFYRQSPTMPYFLLLKLLLWLFVSDEGEIFGKAERLEAPDDLQKIKNKIMS